MFQFNFYLFILWLNFSSIFIYLFKFITALKCEDQFFALFRHLILESEVKLYGKFFQSFSFSHICRQGNSVAQNLTRYSIYVSSLLVWINDVSPTLNNVLLANCGWIFFIEKLKFPYQYIYIYIYLSCALLFSFFIKSIDYPLMNKFSCYVWMFSYWII